MRKPVRCSEVSGVSVLKACTKGHWQVFSGEYCDGLLAISVVIQNTSGMFIKYDREGN